MAKKGLCSTAQKAEYASRNIYPPGIVKVLIIDGGIRIKDKDEYEYEYENDGYEYNDYQDNAENTLISSNETPFYSNTDDIRAVTLLRRKRTDDDIAVALLHISYGTGYELLEIILNEETDVRKAGGTLVRVDGSSPPVSSATIVIWSIVCVVLSLFICCCLVNAMEDLLEAQEPEPEGAMRYRV